ncbi:MAG: lipopolysaccharide assembly protein LapB [Gammaproteobacteria bacterium SHHR-1]
MEWLLLLLPLAAASGWYSGRRSAGRTRPRAGQGCDLDQAYFEGLNLLLNEQPDRAVDHFIEMLEVNTETVETHLALGGLFRRRGEVDRAIRIHQNLIARPSLSREQRHQALLELGRDYLKAGLYDRAIALFDELLEQSHFHLQALQHLHQIYQRISDWHQALATASRLEAMGGGSLKRERAHYQCELAEQALTKGDDVQASQLLKAALASDSHCVRASIGLARLAQRRGDLDEAIRRYSAVAEQDPNYMDEVLRPLAECYESQCGQGQSTAASEFEQGLQQTLQRAARQLGSLKALEMLLERYLRQGQGAQAKALLLDYLEHYPSSGALQQLLCLDPADAEVAGLLRRGLARLVGAEHPYQCGQCGFVARQLHWQCPGCGRWGELKPRILMENQRKAAVSGLAPDSAESAQSAF